MSAPTTEKTALDPLDFLAISALLDDEEKAIRDTVRQFVREQVLPEVGDWFERGVLPREVMSDTAGYSDVIFGLFWLLGYQFSPRLADLGESRFWRIDPAADYGTHFVYQGHEAGSPGYITRINLDADRDHRVTLMATKDANEVEPTWSPDGQWIAFTSDRPSGAGRRDFNIWAVRADGSAPTPLTDRQGYEGAPSWGHDDKSPNGRVYFHAYLSNDWEIWSVAPRLEEARPGVNESAKRK